MIKINQLKKNKSELGFTLVETLFTIFIFSILMLGTTLLLRNILYVSKQEFGVLTNVDQARMAAANFVSEIRNGAYGANGAFPINQASASQIIFFSTGIKNDGTISKIRYYMTGNTLFKGITNPAGSPLSYNGQPENITTISTKMSLGATPLFYYYDGNYDGTGTPLTDPVNVNSVKYIKMNLIVLKELVKNSSDTFTVTAGASMRNLKTNLGN